MKSEIGNLTSEMTQLALEKSAIEHRLNSSREGMFEAQSSYNGSHYFLSRPVVRDLANADVMCRLFGGYLAEIRDKMEYDFVHDFLQVDKAVTGFVMIGETDEVKEGSWRYLYHGGSLSFTDWKDNADGGTGSNCAFLLGGHYNGMVTNPCQHHSMDRFLCEIPFGDLTP